MVNILLLIFFTSALASAILGAVLFIRPEGVIAFQKDLYKKINWNLEPVSMEKEIRNTRIMGLIMMGITAAAVVYFIALCAFGLRF